MLPPLTVATESWPPNVTKAAALLGRRGVQVVADTDVPPLPLRDGAFDLVVSRHPVTVWWHEIARVLQPGGTYLSQQIGPRNAIELIEYFLGPQDSHARSRRDPQVARETAAAAGLEVVDLRLEKLRTVFYDIGAVVYFLRKVIWTVPGFTVEQYRDTLRALHEQIEADGQYAMTTTRFLIEARKPL